jgi:predicted DNA-binding transcriptional regulator YafY
LTKHDRLFHLIQLLRDGNLHKAHKIAGHFQVSVRTIWRDMRELASAGLPIMGERGVGYILRGPITLPPMILTLEESEALQQALSLLSESTDLRFKAAQISLSAKFAPALPLSPQDI